jgi:SAM-dependent methyltransferase
MSQEKEWDREYRDSTFLTKENEPQADVVRFVKFLKKQFKNSKNSESLQDFYKADVLDLGSGAGRNSFYFSELGANVVGFEISDRAIEIAKNFALEAGQNISYKKQNIGEVFPCEDNSFDMALDVTSSNSLSEAEREIYLIETHRVLKDNGYFFVKALCKDTDDNAKNLLKNLPGPEKDTYILPETHITERVWTMSDFVATYEKYFTILHLEKKTSYTHMSGRLYKRNFWIGYMKK